jgi:4-amino-4-deoxy-L-arabinose transferase-like glycosyltransferase
LTPTLSRNERRWLLGLVAIVVALRLATLGAYPLMDSTESRYAELARKMVETGNWVTLQFDYGVPFWGKPPLSTWLSAVAIAALGENEFAVRIPSLLLAIGVGALVWQLGGLRGGRDHALSSLAFFSTSILAFVTAGSVMTDSALLLGTALSMAGFWNAVAGPKNRQRAGGIAFFAGLAIGLLAKGPVAVVLTFLPIVGWTLWTRQWRVVATGLPWLAGTVLAVAAVVPWYWLAEARTPGFLEYFLVGEHWKRFVDAGWKGDLYGAAHARPFGLIWLYGIAAMLPWSVPALVWLGRVIARHPSEVRSLLADPWRGYLLLWAVAPMLFFTLSRNILWTYVLPGIPAFALLLADLWRPGARDEHPDDDGVRRDVGRLLIAGAAVPAAFAAGIVLLHASFETERSHKALVRDYEAARGQSNARLVYVGDRPHSAEFYARGKALRIADAAALRTYLDDANADFFVLRSAELATLPEADRSRLASAGSYGDYRLLREARR